MKRMTKPDADIKKDAKDTAGLTQQDTIAPTEDNYAQSLNRRSLDEEKLNIVAFFLDNVEYAFEVSDAVEVLRPRKFTEVPRTPEFIKGILSVRGEMVPVMDLKKRLGMGQFENEASGRILIASVEDLKAGFMVDKMTGVKDVPANCLETLESGQCGIPAGFLKGVIRVIDKGKKDIFLLNTAKLMDFTAA